MDYKIVLMMDAEEDLDRFISYLLYEKKSEQAARSYYAHFIQRSQHLKYWCLSPLRNGKSILQ